MAPFQTIFLVIPAKVGMTAWGTARAALVRWRGSPYQ
jgi:hypothetical protein